MWGAKIKRHNRVKNGEIKQIKKVKSENGAKSRGKGK